MKFYMTHINEQSRVSNSQIAMKDGKIVEQGTHESLLKAHGYYHDLYSRQFAEESAARLFAKDA